MPTAAPGSLSIRWSAARTACGAPTAASSAASARRAERLAARSGDARAVAEGFQLRERDSLGNLGVARGRAEAAVVAEEHVLRARGRDPALHPVGDDLGM